MECPGSDPSVGNLEVTDCNLKFLDQVLIRSKPLLFVRGHRVMFGVDLALIYGITTKRLNQQVRRNIDRFPADFGFQLDPQELRILRSQFATSSWGPITVQASLHVVRAFVRLRELLGNHEELARRLNDLEARYDGQFKVVFDAIRQLMASAPEPSDRRIGFHSDP